MRGHTKCTVTQTSNKIFNIVVTWFHIHIAAWQILEEPQANKLQEHNTNSIICCFCSLMIRNHKISNVKFKQINFCFDVPHCQTLLPEDRGPGEVQMAWLRAHWSTSRKPTFNSGCTGTGGDREQPPSRDRDQLKGQDLSVATQRPHHLSYGVQSGGRSDVCIITGVPSRQAWISLLRHFRHIPFLFLSSASPSASTYFSSSSSYTSSSSSLSLI